MLRSAFSLLSPAGERARLSILIFHRVHAQRDALFPTEPDARRFDEICNWVKNWFKVLPLDEAVEGLVNRQLPARAACITFDDGYADNLQVALPILHKHQLPATFFITTGYLDGGRMFNDSIVELVRRSSFALLDVSGLGLECSSSLPMNDAAAKVNTILTLIGELKYRPPEVRLELCLLLQKRAGVSRLPDDLMMRSEQVLAMHRAGMQIGAHTVTHPILARLETAAMAAEIQRGKARLEDIIAAPVTMFAYPNGRPHTDYIESTVKLVRDAGFRAAVSTAWGVSNAHTDPFQLPRFTPWDVSSLRFGLRLLANLRRRAELLPTVAA